MNEENKNVFTIMNDKGEEVNCEVLFTFEAEDTKKNYIIYTDNTKDDMGSTKVYASIYDPTGKDRALAPIETEEEWLVIENIMSSLQEKIEKENQENE